MDEMPKEISAVYKEVAGKPILPVGGAYGGPSPDGYSVVAHIYNEYRSTPISEAYTVGDDAEVDFTKGKPVHDPHILTRLVTATLVFSPEAAIRVGKWLVDHGSRAMHHRKNNEPAVESRAE